MTERLYFTDAYAQIFRATVLAVGSRDGKATIQLDRTCFYPTSGGQPFDTGVLAGHPVLDVVAEEDGTVQHLIQGEDAQSGASSVAALQTLVGSEVEGEITWSRRYDHMQQHSGQHLLSQVFYRLFGYETASVHFSANESTLDLAVDELSAAQLAEAEAVANELVYAALPIRAYFVTEAELPTVPLRKAPSVRGQIRIVEIDQYDYSACGGTHCRTTAELGPIKCTKVERRRGQVRVTFLCGQRAYRDYVAKHDLLLEAAALFSNEISQVPTLIERNLAQLKGAQKTISRLEDELLQYEATTLRQAAEEHGKLTVIEAVLGGRDINSVKRLATLLQQQPDVVTLFATVEGEKATLCFGSSTGDAQVHMGQLLRATLEAFGGKGGGKADVAQGGGIAPAQVQEALALAKVKLLQL